MARTALPLPLNQLAFVSVDLRVTERWWREGLGFLPAGGNSWLFRGPSFWAIQGIVGVNARVWWLVGLDDWAQIEIWQYNSPVSKLMPADATPADIGYTRIGVWVADFCGALERLAALGSRPLSPPLGERGSRRACVRNPDGVFVELMEDDPVAGRASVAHPECGVALRSITLSTPDLAKSAKFFSGGLGLAEGPQLHSDAHEALWGLAGAECSRRVFASPSGILLEVAEYKNPRGRPRPEGYRICDQGILNFAFGDPACYHGVHGMLRRARAAGAKANSFPIHIPIAGVVYVNDPQGVSVEFMWAGKRIGRRTYGFDALPIERRVPAETHCLDFVAEIPMSPAEVFAAISQPEKMNAWLTLGRFSPAPDKASATGYGGERIVRTAAGRLREQIIEWRPGEAYRYRIISFSPFVGYLGEVRLTPVERGTRIDWRIRFRARVPGTGGVLSRVLASGMKKSLGKLQRLSCRPIGAAPPTADIHVERSASVKIVRLVLLNVLLSAAIVAAGHLISYLAG